MLLSRLRTFFGYRLARYLLLPVLGLFGALALLGMSSALTAPSAHAQTSVTVDPSDTVTVKPGDTLGVIASAHKATWQQLATLNKSTVHDPNVIYVGQKIVVRGKAAPATTKPATSKAPAGSKQAAPAPAPAAAVTSSNKGSSVVAYAKAQLGKPYVWGGAGPNAFDCSGLTMQALKSVGVNLPHNTTMQMTHGVSVAKANLALGDVVFYYDGGHAAIYAGNDMVIHAPTSGQTVQYASLNSMPYYSARRL